MDPGGLNPQDMQQYLQGVNWPADQEQVAQTDESNGVPQGCSIRSGTSGMTSSPILRT